MTLKCLLGFHKLRFKKYDHPVPPFTLPMHVCVRCGKVKYKLMGDET